MQNCRRTALNKKPHDSRLSNFPRIIKMQIHAHSTRADRVANKDVDSWLGIHIYIYMNFISLLRNFNSPARPYLLENFSFVCYLLSASQYFVVAVVVVSIDCCWVRAFFLCQIKMQKRRERQKKKQARRKFGIFSTLRFIAIVIFDMPMIRDIRILKCRNKCGCWCHCLRASVKHSIALVRSQLSDSTILYLYISIAY